MCNCDPQTAQEVFAFVVVKLDVESTMLVCACVVGYENLMTIVVLKDMLSILCVNKIIYVEWG